MSKWLVGKFLEGYIELPISENEESIPQNFGTLFSAKIILLGDKNISLDSL